ncbi:Uncharacterized protein Rs2_09589 [Raphanus sativus]|nr:Uncharacterized protein Rs2_09589 [Raphanus sativus]
MQKITTIRNEHDVQLKAFKCHYEDDYKKLQDELDLQRLKEERQRALLQMQWRVMSDKAPEEQEVSTRKGKKILEKKWITLKHNAKLSFSLLQIGQEQKVYRGFQRRVRI